MTLYEATSGKPAAGQCDRPCASCLTRRALTAGMGAAVAGLALHMARRPLIASAVAAPATSNASDTGDACPAQAADQEADATQVVIENFTFNPDTLTVPVGTTATWTNRDDIPHTVTSDDKTTIASSLLDTGDQFSFQFTAPGTYPYFCSVHPMMTAKVVVQS